MKYCQAPEKLSLKAGAAVILLKNVDPKNGLVNGVRGIVVDFKQHSKPSELSCEYKRMKLPVVRFDPIQKDQHEADTTEAPIVLPTEWTNKVGDNISVHGTKYH